MSDQPNEQEPTVPAWQSPLPQPEPTNPLSENAEPLQADVAQPLQPNVAEPRSNGSRTAVAIITVLAVLGTAVSAVIYTNSTGHHSSTPLAFQATGVPRPTGTSYPDPLTSTSPGGDTQSAAPAPRTSQPAYNSATTQSFDWNSLNNSNSDPTPFTQGALLPQSFVDSRNITYELMAGGEKSCVQSTMSQSIQDVLNKYHCTNAMTGSYLEDAGIEKVTPNNDILISVQIWPFADAATADDVEKALAAANDKQFSIWCPTTGAGAGPCNSQNYYSAATWWSLQGDYRYVVEATAVYTNMTQNSSVAYTWEKTATAEAVKDCGPQVYGNSQSQDQ
jgi:hypothetical protein